MAAPRAKLVPLGDAIAQHVHDGDAVALEGFTHLIPFAAAHEIIRQRRRELTLVRMTPDLVYDQLIGMGCARRMVFSWGGNPGVGSLHRFRDAVEHAWPRPLQIEEYSHAAMAAAYQAGASGLPFAMLHGFVGNDLPRHNAHIRHVRCPYTNRAFATVPALNPDVTVLHAQCADRAGNVMIQGIVGAQKEAALAARRLLVTVERVVDEIDLPLNGVLLPHWVVSAVSLVPGGAYPSYAHGHYPRDNGFYLRWDEVSRERDGFLAWMDEHVLGVADFAGHLDKLRAAALAVA
ncbi:MAG: CoA-transferase [Burkholderiaceae bacterium]